MGINIFPQVKHLPCSESSWIPKAAPAAQPCRTPRVTWGQSPSGSGATFCAGIVITALQNWNTPSLQPEDAVKCKVVALELPGSCTLTVPVGHTLFQKPSPLVHSPPDFNWGFRWLFCTLQEELWLKLHLPGDSSGTADHGLEQNCLFQLYFSLFHRCGEIFIWNVNDAHKWALLINPHIWNTPIMAPQWK